MRGKGVRRGRDGPRGQYLRKSTLEGERRGARARRTRSCSGSMRSRLGRASLASAAPLLHQHPTAILARTTFTLAKTALRIGRRAGATRTSHPTPPNAVPPRPSPVSVPPTTESTRLAPTSPPKPPPPTSQVRATTRTRALAAPTDFSSPTPQKPLRVRPATATTHTVTQSALRRGTRRSKERRAVGTVARRVSRTNPTDDRGTTRSRQPSSRCTNWYLLDLQVGGLGLLLECRREGCGWSRRTRLGQGRKDGTRSVGTAVGSGRNCEAEETRWRWRRAKEERE